MFIFLKTCPFKNNFYKISLHKKKNITKHIVIRVFLRVLNQVHWRGSPKKRFNIRWAIVLDGM
jgi:hypothetical protein